MSCAAHWGSDFSHFYRGARLMADPARSEAWALLKPDRYRLDQANEALAAVAAVEVVKALIAPQF